MLFMVSTFFENLGPLQEEFKCAELSVPGIGMDGVLSLISQLAQHISGKLQDTTLKDFNITLVCIAFYFASTPSK